MLYEWLEHLLTNCPPHLREMGCLNEMLGLRRRWRRYRDAWEPHCRRARELILAAASRCPRRRRAVVLGSGWLHDVPVEALAKSFEKIELVDLFHPFQVRRQTRRYRNVTLLAEDVTQTLFPVYSLAYQDPAETLPTRHPSRLIDETDLDLTVSLNLLSQLPCLPENYLRSTGLFSNEVILEYCRGLIRSHLESLQALSGVVAVMTDVEVRYLGRASQETSRVDTLYGIELPWRGDTWDWALVPGREVLTVVGIEDVKDTKRA